MGGNSMKKLLPKVLSLVLIIIMCVAVFSGCSTNNKGGGQTSSQAGDSTASGKDTGTQTAAKTDSPLKGKRIGATIVYKGDEWCSMVDKEFVEQAKIYGCEITVHDGNLDTETQTKQIENFIAQKVDMIFADPATPEGCIPALKKAEEAGIPVIIFDGYVEGFDPVTTVAWDNALTGELMGNYCKEYIEKELGGKANVAVLTLAQSTHCLDREAKFKEIMATIPGVKIISTQDCEGNREKGANAIANIKEHIDIVYSVVDNGAWGAVTALEARNAKGTKVVSSGAYGAEPFEALKENHPYYMACVVVPPAELVKQVYIAAEKYFKGEPVEKNINIDIAVADASNVHEFWP